MDKYELRLTVGKNVTEYIKHPVLYKHKELLKELVDSNYLSVTSGTKNRRYIKK